MFISSYLISLSIGLIQYWSDNDRPNALSSNSSGVERLSLASKISNLSLHDGIPLPLNHLDNSTINFSSSFWLYDFYQPPCTKVQGLFED